MWSVAEGEADPLFSQFLFGDWCCFCCVQDFLSSGLAGMRWCSFSLGWRCEQSQPTAKVGAFLYCVLRRYFANHQATIGRIKRFPEVPKKNFPICEEHKCPSRSRRHGQASMRNTLLGSLERLG